MQACLLLFRAATWSFNRFMPQDGSDVIPFGCVRYQTQLLLGKIRHSHLRILMWGLLTSEEI